MVIGDAEEMMIVYEMVCSQGMLNDSQTIIALLVDKERTSHFMNPY